MRDGWMRPIGAGSFRQRWAGMTPADWAIGKAAIGADEIVADILNLVLAKIVFTPVQVTTKNSKHTVRFVMI